MLSGAGAACGGGGRGPRGCVKLRFPGVEGPALSWAAARSGSRGALWAESHLAELGVCHRNGVSCLASAARRRRTRSAGPCAPSGDGPADRRGTGTVRGAGDQPPTQRRMLFSEVAKTGRWARRHGRRLRTRPRCPGERRRGEAAASVRVTPRRQQTGRRADGTSSKDTAGREKRRQSGGTL